MRGVLRTLAPITLALASCSGLVYTGPRDGGPPDGGCAPGASAACTCPSGALGAARCADAGVYGVCTCESPDSGLADGGVDGGADAGTIDGGCLSNADCVGAFSGSLCNQATGLCVECLQPTDCSYADPGCHAGTCGFCVSAAECLPHQVCSGGFCQCQGNSGCGGSTPVCGDAGICECTGSSDCGSGQVCDNLNFVYGNCVASCTGNAAACTNGNTDCSPAGICVPCLSNGECADAGMGKFCTPLGCAQCTADSQCSVLDAGTPYCFNICVQCRTAADCPASNKGCNAATATCGSCVFNGDCPQGSGCSSTNVCIGICIPDAGVCAKCQASSDCAGTAQCNLNTGICS